MAWAVAYNGTSSQTSGGAEQTVGNSGAAITAAGTYMLVVDVNLLANASTPDIVAMRGYLKGYSGGTERLLFEDTLLGAQSVIYMSFAYPSPISIRFAIIQPQGTNRALPWAVWSGP